MDGGGGGGGGHTHQANQLGKEQHKALQGDQKKVIHHVTPDFCKPALVVWDLELPNLTAVFRQFFHTITGEGSTVKVCKSSISHFDFCKTFRK